MLNNLRVLIKERNKVLFLSNALGSVLEFNYSLKAPLIAFLLLKRLNAVSDEIRANCQNLAT
jgi:hypothetical protein